MATIDLTYFFDELLIADKDNNANSIKRFINQLEPWLLTELMGYALYKAYAAGISAGSPDAKWLAIRDGKEYTVSGVLVKWQGLIFKDGPSGDEQSKKSLIANYVYWHWIRNNNTVTTAAGEMQAKAGPIAANTTSKGKTIRAWNQMVDWNKSFVDFLYFNVADYPEFKNHSVPCHLLEKQNTLGL